jgi:UDP-N-acetylmuramate--alanine ligase
MRSLAGVLEGAGWSVTGSDVGDAARLPTRWRVADSHSMDNLLSMPNLVVYSPAIETENVELAAARRLGIETVSYPAMLGRLMANRLGIAIAGTHGKSTTAAMVASILGEADLDPTVVVGAELRGTMPLSRFGTGRAMVVEACEYRDSFLALKPRIATILGVEPDHFDYFASPAQLEQAFANFSALLPEYGVMIARAACGMTQRALAHCRARMETFGMEPNADWHASTIHVNGGCYSFELWRRDKRMGRVRLSVPGRHNVLNALAAAAVASHAGATATAIVAGLQRFRGLKRRLETLGEFDGLTVLDDYAHHPTEIVATLATVREMYPGARVWCVFEPHQACRTKSLLDELAQSLQNADTLAVAEIFRAREPAWQSGEITAADLARRAEQYGAQVAPVHALGELEAWIWQNWQSGSLRAGDVLVTLGAGNIGNVAHGIQQRIRKNCAVR